MPEDPLDVVIPPPRWPKALQEQLTSNLVAAAVLIPIIHREETLSVLLTERSPDLKHHAGQISFPGGRMDAADRDIRATALRETQEEVGIDAECVSPLGELQPMVTRTGFEVHPCIARVPAQLDYTVDPGEFDSVFSPQLARFADKACYRLEPMSDGERSRMVPHYQVEQDNVWGVTAAVLAQLVNIALDAGLDLQRNWSKKP